MHTTTLLIWGLLLAGLALVFGDLARNTLRFFQWRGLRAYHEGEIVRNTDTLLQTGQPAALTAAFHADSRPEAGALPAVVAATDKTTLALAAEPVFEPVARAPHPADWPKLGATVFVTVTGADALYRFQTRVRDSRPDVQKPTLRILSVERPTFLARIQRRQHVRAPMSLPASFVCATDAQRNPLTRLPQHGTVVELSAGGFQAQIGGVLSLSESDEVVQAFAPGVVVRVTLSPPGLAQSPLLARVRVCNKIAVRGGLGVRVACEFLPMAPWEQELIVQHIFRDQRERLRERARARQTAA
ncbi:MAG TPA: PilZ domain-containing protein [Chthonomonadaceae bacterium]|nr:PilZ domain-containing protein [Chthonomonadaceae bacterium]